MLAAFPARLFCQQPVPFALPRSPSANLPPGQTMQGHKILSTTSEFYLPPSLRPHPALANPSQPSQPRRSIVMPTPGLKAHSTAGALSLRHATAIPRCGHNQLCMGHLTSQDCSILPATHPSPAHHGPRSLTSLELTVS